MVRTVRVRLELDREDYKRGLRDAADDTRGFDAEVKSAGNDLGAMGVEAKASARETEAMGRQADTAAKSTKTLGDETEKTKQKTTELGGETRKTKQETTSLGDEISKTSTRMADLRREITETEQNVRDLAKAWVATRNTDVQTMLRGQQDALRGLRAEYEKVKQDAEKGPGLVARLFNVATPSLSNSEIKAVKDAGLKAGTAFSGGFLSSAARIVGAGAPVLVPALVALVGGAAVAAGLGTVGGAAIAAGIVAQFSDPRVKGAALDLGTYLKTQLVESTTGFVGPFTSGIAALKREASPLWADLQRGFQSLEPYVANFLVKIGEGLAKLGPGLGRAMESAGPILGAIAKNIPTVLNGVNIFFDEISKGGKGATEAIDAIMKAVSLLVAAFGFALRGAVNLYDFMVQASDKITGLAAKVADALGPAAGPGGTAIKKLADYTHGVATSFDESKLSADGASGALDMFTGSADSADTAAGGLAGAVGMVNDRMSTAIGTMSGLDGAAVTMSGSLQSLKDSISQNGTSLDINTQSGRANVQAMLDGVQSAEALRQAQINSGLSAAYADSEYQKNIESLRQVMLNAGMNKDAVDAMIQKYLHVPGSVSTSILTPGMDDALRKADGLKQVLQNLDGSVSRASVITYYTSEVLGARPAKGVGFSRWGNVFEHAAVGKLREADIYSAAAPARYAFAEPQTGGEFFGPKYGNLARTRELATYAVENWWGGHVTWGNERPAPNYAAFANGRPMAYSGGGSTNVNVTLSTGGGTTSADRALAGLVAYAIRSGSLMLKVDADGNVRVR